MIREITIGDQKYDMYRLGVVLKHQHDGWIYGTHVPATSDETRAMYDWARQHGATIKRFDGRDNVWDLQPARAYMNRLKSEQE